MPERQKPVFMLANVNGVCSLSFNSSFGFTLGSILTNYLLEKNDPNVSRLLNALNQLCANKPLGLDRIDYEEEYNEDEDQPCIFSLVCINCSMFLSFNRTFARALNRAVVNGVNSNDQTMYAFKKYLHREIYPETRRR